jgi:hypothetical protein
LFVIINDNILSEYANYLEYFNRFFTFLCTVSAFCKACTIDENPFWNSLIRLYLAATNFITYLVGLVAGLAPGMNNGALSRQHTCKYVNPSSLNYRQPISIARVVDSYSNFICRLLNRCEVSNQPSFVKTISKTISLFLAFLVLYIFER